MGKWKNGTISFLYSFAVLLFISQNSPLCKFNMWLDATVYQGIIQAMDNGEILYADVFDHKGPFFHEAMALVNLLVNDCQMTMFIFEVISIGLFILFAYKIAKLYLSDSQAMISAILLVSVFLILPNSKATGETEEILMGLLMIIFYLWNKYWKEKDLKTSEFFTAGLMTGIVFLSKFTVAFEGLCLFGLIVLYECFTGRIKSGIRKMFILLGGFFLSFVPCIIYCLFTDSLKAAVNTYFLFNISYGSNAPSFWIKPVIFMTLFMVLVLFSLFAQFRIDREENRFKTVSVIIYVAGLAIMIFGAKRYYEYLFDVFYPVIIFTAVWLMGNVKIKKLFYPAVFCLAVITVLGNASVFILPNWIWCEKTGNEMLAEDIAERIDRENPSILLLQSECGGIYDLLDTYPQLRFHYSPNIDNEKDTTVIDEQLSYIADAKPDVIVLGNPDYLDYIGDEYEYWGTYELYQMKGQPTALQMVFARK